MNDTGEKMMGYLPTYWHENKEMQQILNTSGAEIALENEAAVSIYRDAFIMQANEKRIAEWEQRLKLPPVGTLDERRRKILSYFQVFVKLNEGVIQTLAAILYRDARARVRFIDSTIKIVIIPLPENYLDTETALIVQQLEPKKPCHIGLSASRFTCTWDDINKSFTTWGQALAKRPKWYDIKLHVPDYIE